MSNDDSDEVSKVKGQLLEEQLVHSGIQPHIH